MRKTSFVFLALLLCVVLTIVSFAHSGRTDSKGGHYDRSSGEYHYHHGKPAHDHYDMDGDGDKDCPYTFKPETTTKNKFEFDLDTVELPKIDTIEEFDTIDFSKFKHNQSNTKDENKNNSNDLPLLEALALVVFVFPFLMIVIYYIIKVYDKHKTK